MIHNFWELTNHSLMLSRDHGLPGLHLLERLFRPHLSGVLEEEGGVEDGGQGATHRDAKVSDVADLEENTIKPRLTAGKI